jgi:hypothetical protein
MNELSPGDAKLLLSLLLLDALEEGNEMLARKIAGVMLKKAAQKQRVMPRIPSAGIIKMWEVLGFNPLFEDNYT